MGIFTGSKSIAERDKEIKLLTAQVENLKKQNTRLVEEKAKAEHELEDAQVSYTGICIAYNAAIDEKHALQARNAELERVLRSIDRRMVRLDRGGAELLAKRDALVEKETQA